MEEPIYLEHFQKLFPTLDLSHLPEDTPFILPIFTAGSLGAKHCARNWGWEWSKRMTSDPGMALLELTDTLRPKHNLQRHSLEH